MLLKFRFLEALPTINSSFCEKKKEIRVKAFIAHLSLWISVKLNNLYLFVSADFQLSIGWTSIISQMIEIALKMPR